MDIKNYHHLELSSKPDIDACIQRIYAWYNNDIIDRVPVRFSIHNSFVEQKTENKKYHSHKERWFDSEYQVRIFKENLKGQCFKGETFPAFWCNLGPNVYSAYFGTELTYAETTSWTNHNIIEWNDLAKLKFSYDNEYFKKTEELMRVALQMCDHDFMVGYTDLHGGMDCVEGWRDPQSLCMDLYDYEEEVLQAVKLADSKFLEVFDYFDDILKKAGQLSIDWMGIPSYGKLHIPSCDFSALISNEQFVRFCLPSILMEIKHMDHNVFHLDGEGVARHLDYILALPEINAIQWVPSPGNPKGIFHYIDMYKKIQHSGKGLVLDIDPSDLDEFMERMKPRGIFLCMGVTDPVEQEAILHKLLQWK